MTAREWEVIDLLKAWRTTEQIAGERVLATETVRTHVKHILRELKVHLRREAVGWPTICAIPRRGLKIPRAGVRSHSRRAPC